MDLTNPYEPPHSEPPNLREQKFAKRLLSFRDRPLTISALYRGQAKAQVILFIYFGLAIAYFFWADLQLGIHLMLSSFAMARIQTKLWPMQKKVLDWEKVERMADGERLAA
jgi:hypothetical protein